METKKGKHIIYHIFGRKIGCTQDLRYRMARQKVKEGEYEIIEYHTNAKVASEREIELQKQYGYPVDRIPYWKTLRNQNAKNRKLVAKTIDWSFKYRGIVQYDLDGNYIATYTCGADAAQAMGKKRTNDDIRKVARGQNLSAFGYIWKFVNINNEHPEL